MSGGISHQVSDYVGLGQQLPEQTQNEFLVQRQAMITQGLIGIQQTQSVDQLVSSVIPTLLRVNTLFKLSCEERGKVVEKLLEVLETKETTLGQLTDILDTLNCYLEGRRMQIVIDWKLSYNLFRNLQNQTHKGVFLPKSIQITFIGLNKFISKARKYFSEGAAQEIYELFREGLSSNSEDLMKSAAYLTALLPRKSLNNHVILDDMGKAWKQIKNNLAWDSKFSDFFATVATFNKSFEFDYQFFYSKLLHVLNLKTEDGNYEMQYNQYPYPYNFLGASHKQVIKNLTKLIVNSNIDLLPQLMRQIHTYYHNSNQPYNRLIDFIKQLSVQLCYKKKWSHNFNTDPIIEAILPSLELLMHNYQKGDDSSYVVKHLAQLNPIKVCEWVMPIICQQLEDQNIPHNLPMAILSQITTILLDKGNFPQGIMLLSTAIGTVGQQMSGSNANITISVLKVMEAMSESMMLYDISYFDEDEVYNKPEYNFLVQLQTVLDDFFINLLEILSQLEEKSNTPNDQFKQFMKQFGFKNNQYTQILTRCFRNLTNCIGDRTIEMWAEILIDKVKYQCYSNAQEEFMVLIQIISRKRPDLILSELIQLCWNNVRDSSGLNSNKQKILWYGKLLGCCIERNDEFYNSKSQIIEIVQKLLDQEEKELFKLGCYLVRMLFEGVSKVFIDDFAPIEMGSKQSKVLYEIRNHKCDNLNPQWSVPQQNDFKILRELFDRFINPILEADSFDFRQIQIIKQSYLGFEKIQTSFDENWRDSIISWIYKYHDNNQLLVKTKLIKLIQIVIGKKGQFSYSSLKFQKAHMNKRIRFQQDKTLHREDKRQKETRLQKLQRLENLYNLFLSLQKECRDFSQSELDLLQFAITCIFYENSKLTQSASDCLQSIFGQFPIAQLQENLFNAILQQTLQRTADFKEKTLQIQQGLKNLFSRVFLQYLIKQPGQVMNSILNAIPTLQNCDDQKIQIAFQSGFTVILPFLSTPGLYLQGEYQFQKSEFIIERVLEIFQSMHWKYQTYLLVFATIVLPMIENQNLLLSLLNICLDLITNEVYTLRNIAYRLSNLIMYRMIKQGIQADQDLQRFQNQEYINRLKVQIIIDIQLEQERQQQNQQLPKFQANLFNFIAQIGELDQTLNNLMMVEEGENNEKKWPPGKPILNYQRVLFIENVAKLIGPSNLQILVQFVGSKLQSQKQYKQIFAAEIISGLVRGMKIQHSQEIEQVCVNAINGAIQNQSLDNFDIWNSVIALCTYKRTQNNQILNQINNDPANYQQTTRQVKAINSMMSIIYNLKMQGISDYEKWISNLSLIDNEIQDLVRISIARSISAIYQFCQQDSISFIQQFINILKSKNSFDAKMLVLIIMQFILNAERGWGSSSNLIIVNIHHAIDLLSDPDTFVQEQAKQLMDLVSKMILNGDQLSQVFSILQESIQLKLQWQVKQRLIQLLANIWSINQFNNDLEIQTIEQIISQDQFELNNEIYQLLTIYYKTSSIDYLNQKIQKLDKSQNRSIWIACAIINAFPYSVPDWMPSLLMLICEKKSENEFKGIISKTITRFWKTHISWWRSYQCFSEKFTKDQLEVLEEFKGNHYYFA